MGRPSNFSRAFDMAIKLDVEKEALQGAMTGQERCRSEVKLKRINNYFTKGKTAKAHHWQRPLLSAVMKLYPSMTLPPLPRLLELPEIQSVLAMKGSPTFWSLSENHIIADFRVVLKKFKFSLAKTGRPIRKRP
jgi:hypothetical protein